MNSARRTRTGRANGRTFRYPAENCNAYRTPEWIAELEACYQAIVAARGSGERGWRLLKLRGQGMAWTVVVEEMCGG